MRIRLSILLFLLGISFSAFSQSASGTDSSTEIPVTFLISEDDAAFGDLVSKTTTSLLDVCDNTMDAAYKKWIYMLADLEEEAEVVGFDVKGLKVWMNVFWNADGSIQNIVYYPKPNSKNIDYKEFTKFLNHFAEYYVLDVEATDDFAHYGSASFPTFIAQMFPDRSK